MKRSLDELVPIPPPSPPPRPDPRERVRNALLLLSVSLGVAAITVLVKEFAPTVHRTDETRLRVLNSDGVEVYEAAYDDPDDCLDAGRKISSRVLWRCEQEPLVLPEPEYVLK